MEGCPHCVDFKEMLQKEGIEFVDRDIQENEEEYQVFVEVTQNDFVPALLIIEEDEGENYKSFLYAPDRDFEDIDQGLNIIKEFYER